MKRFGYGTDWVCLASWALYALNRFAIDPALKGPFMRDHFNDLLLVPAVLPLVLWVQRRLGLRADDAPPRALEVALHVCAWSFMAEVIAPLLTQRATGDVLDVAAYTAGALGAWCLWSVR